MPHDGESDDGEEHRQDLPGDDEEARHFLDCCWSLMKYQQDAMRDVQLLEESLKTLDVNDRALWQVETTEWIQEISWRIQENSMVLAGMPNPQVCSADLGPDEYAVVKQVPDDHRVASRNCSKVRSTLRQFVRDWAVEGEAERTACYSPLVEA